MQDNINSIFLKYSKVFKPIQIFLIIKARISSGIGWETFVKLNPLIQKHDIIYVENQLLSHFNIKPVDVKDDNDSCSISYIDPNTILNVLDYWYDKLNKENNDKKKNYFFWFFG